MTGYRANSDSRLGPSESVPRVIAVVVAYNSPAALKRCLRCLDAQSKPVDAVLVVDNSQPQPLHLPGLVLSILLRTEFVGMGENLGPAGGFAYGLASFVEKETFTHAWLMDDDTYAEPDALATLLEVAEKTRPGHALFPAAVYEATGISMNYPGWSGVLLDRLAVRLAGLPKAELFWWAEDTEYLQHRLPLKGVTVIRVNNARMLYDLIRRKGGRPAWKYYYEVRNTIWMHTVIYRGNRLLRLPRVLVRLLGSALTSQDRAQKLRMYMRGLHHGMSAMLGRDVVPPHAVVPPEGYGTQ